MSYAICKTRSAACGDQAAGGRLPGQGVLYFDEIQEVKDWEKCMNSCASPWIAIFTSRGSKRKAPSGELAPILRPLCGVCDLSLFLRGILEFYVPARPAIPSRSASSNTSCTEVCRTWQTSGMRTRPRKQYLQEPIQFRSAQGYRAAKQNQGCGPVARIIAYVMANVGNTFSATLWQNSSRANSAPWPRKRFSIISNIAVKPICSISQTEDLHGKQILASNGSLYCRPWHP
jgi:hypothetical protein